VARRRFGVDLGRGVLKPVGPSAEQDDVEAILGKLSGDGAPDPGSTAGNEC
jgi:hypothetical protein